jgi:hypothetical protein
MRCTLTNYTKNLEKSILIYTYIDLNQRDQFLRMSDQALIQYFNQNKLTRQFCDVVLENNSHYKRYIQPGTHVFLGKYYTYNGNELMLKDSTDIVKKIVCEFLNSIKGDTRTYDIFKALVEAVIYDLNRGIDFPTVYFSQVNRFYSVKTGKLLPARCNSWSKIQHYGFCERYKKGRIEVPKEMYPAILEAIRDWKKGKCPKIGGVFE